MTSPQRWAHLAGAAFRLDGVAQPRADDVVRELDSVLEVFDASIDPAEDFEGAAVRRFAASLRRALEAARRP